MDTINDQAVARSQEGILVLAPKRCMTPEEAVRFACWLLTLADLPDEYVAEQWDAIKNT